MGLPFPREYSQLTRGKTNTFTTSGLSALSRWPYSASPFLPAFPKAARSQNYRAFLHSQCFPERINQTPKAEGICPNPQRISEATNKRAPRSYLNKGSIVSMASSTIFNTGVYFFLLFLNPWYGFRFMTSTSLG